MCRCSCDILDKTIDALAKTVYFCDDFTVEHQKNVLYICDVLCDEYELDENTKFGIITAAKLHDIGKLSIPKIILNRRGPLKDTERELLKRHCEMGVDILKDIPFKEPVTTYILQHHERLDGSGYPNGTCGDDMLFGSRLLSLVDVFEALIHKRPYRSEIFTYEQACDLLLDEVASGKFDKDITLKLCELVNSNKLPKMIF